MTAVATFELKTLVENSIIEDRVSQYWCGQGYTVDICSWRPGQANRLYCVLKYYFYRNLQERNMLVMAAKSLLEFSYAELIYYRCIDFVGDLEVADPANRMGGRLMGCLKVEDLLQSQYEPSMTSSEIYVIK